MPLSTAKMELGTVYVDDRVGSREFAAPLGKMALKVQVCRLDSADFALMGNGKAGPIRIGVERKTLPDLVGSLLKGRLVGHQIPQMLRDFDHCYLLIEGYWRCDPQSDAIQVLRGGWQDSRMGITHPQLSRWLMDFDFFMGSQMRRIRTLSAYETCHFVNDLARYLWKPWAKHSAYAAIGKTKPGDVPEKVTMTRPSNLMRVAASLPDVGTKTARTIARSARSIGLMMNWDEEQFVELGGMKPALAKKLHEEIWRRAR